MLWNSPDLSDSLTAARNLLGWKLVHENNDGKTSGYIVEVEAYDTEDPASHAYGGIKNRNSPMFEQAGTIYVYFTYGMHYCVNIVTGPKNNGQAVLIRAIQPVDGIEIMKKRRKNIDLHSLTNGPAKLTQAMGITKALNGSKLGGDLYLEPGINADHVKQTTRIGIKKAVDLPWRFYITGNPYVSKI